MGLPHRSTWCEVHAKGINLTSQVAGGQTYTDTSDDLTGHDLSPFFSGGLVDASPIFGREAARFAGGAVVGFYNLARQQVCLHSTGNTLRRITALLLGNPATSHLICNPVKNIDRNNCDHVVFAIAVSPR